METCGAGLWKARPSVIAVRPFGCVSLCLSRARSPVSRRNGGGYGDGVGSRPRNRVQGAAVCLGEVLRARCYLPTLPRAGEARGARNVGQRDQGGFVLGASVLWAFWVLRLSIVRFQVLLTSIGTFRWCSVALVV